MRLNSGNRMCEFGDVHAVRTRWQICIFSKHVRVVSWNIFTLYTTPDLVLEAGDESRKGVSLDSDSHGCIWREHAKLLIWRKVANVSQVRLPAGWRKNMYIAAAVFVPPSRREAEKHELPKWSRARFRHVDNHRVYRMDVRKDMIEIGKNFLHAGWC